MPTDPYFQKVELRKVSNTRIHDMNKHELLYFLKSQLQDTSVRQENTKSQLVTRTIQLRTQRPNHMVFLPRIAPGRLPVGARLVETGLRTDYGLRSEFVIKEPSRPRVTGVNEPYNVHDRGSVSIENDRRFHTLYPVMGKRGPVLKGLKYENESWYVLSPSRSASSPGSSTPAPVRGSALVVRGGSSSSPGRSRTTSPSPARAPARGMGLMTRSSNMTPDEHLVAHFLNTLRYRRI